MVLCKRREGKERKKEKKERKKRENEREKEKRREKTYLVGEACDLGSHGLRRDRLLDHVPGHIAVLTQAGEDLAGLLKNDSPPAVRRAGFVK